MQVDGYAGYRKLADAPLAFWWSHVRRNFYELATPGPVPIAREALEDIAKLYAIENDIRGRSADVRQQKSRSLRSLAHVTQYERSSGIRSAPQMFVSGMGLFEASEMP